MKKLPRGLYKRGKYLWMTWVDASGRRHRKSTKTDNVTRARAMLEERRVRARKGEVLASGRYIFADLVERYQEVSRLKPSWKSLTKYIVRDLLERFYYVELDKLTAYDAEKLLAEKHQACKY